MSSPRLSATSAISLIVLAISTPAQARDCHHRKFGSCSDPSIYNSTFDNSHRNGYLPVNIDDFPHGWSPDIASIESFICNRLESPCNAPAETIQRCRDAFNRYSGLSGQNAIEAWNVALGVSDEDHADNDDDCEPDQGYQTTTTTTVYVPFSPTDTSHPGDTALTITTTTTTETSTAETTTTHTQTYTTDTYEAPSPSSTLTITLTLPSSTSTNQQAISAASTSTLTETQTSVTTEGTDTTTSVASQTTGSSNNNDNYYEDSGGGSPFDPESSAPSAQLPCGRFYGMFLVGIATLAVAFCL